MAGSQATAAKNGERSRSETSPAWVDPVFVGLIIYVAIAAILMLTGVCGREVTHWIGLLGDLPSSFCSVLFSVTAARRAPQGALRMAWIWMSIALALYFTGSSMDIVSWLRGRDPFPGPSDLLCLAFYPAAFIAALYLIRAAAVRVPWVRLSIDAAICVVGFGAFFWFLVIRPAQSVTEVDVLKQMLSQVYAWLDCLLLLMYGVLLLAEAEWAGGRRIALLLWLGFSTLFLADILWSSAKVGGVYLSGGLHDVLYLCCYLPLAAAGREQIRASHSPARAVPHHSDAFARSLPFAAMLTAFLVLVYLNRGDIGGPATEMTVIVFVLTLLLMARQAINTRVEVASRERRATRMVEERYASLIANASDVIMIVRPDGVMRFTSPASERMLGLKAEDIAGSNLLDLWAGADVELLRTFLAEVAATPDGIVGPVELRIEHGVTGFVLEIVGSNLTNDPAVNGLALNFRDISERKALEEKLRRLAFHDPLTLLANRSLFRDRVQHALTLAQRGPNSVAVLFLDLDNFKNINDSLGHEAGDRLLQAVAQRLTGSTRSSDTVARLGGDEFGVLIEGITTSAEAEYMAGVLVASLGPAFLLNAAAVHVGTSIGVALSTPRSDAAALLSNADLAMYHAKAAGKNRFATFQPQMLEALNDRLRLEADLAGAFDNDEFFLEYQPIVDLGTRALLGVEALIRWRHPTVGVLLPGRFIHVAEECGHVAKLGRWVLTRACRDMYEWRGSVAGGSQLRLAVNISSRHLQHGELVDDVAAALKMSGFEPENLVIELTESTMMYNIDANLERLRQLKALGLRLAIDDFGTGYSSLAYLHRFPIDILKIDRTFISRLTSTDAGSELARAVITLGDTLGLDTVAEGIELEAQVAALLALGCVAGQGFLFAKAGSLQQLSDSEFVARRKAHWTAQAADEDYSATGRYLAPTAVRKRSGGP